MKFGRAGVIGIGLILLVVGSNVPLSSRAAGPAPQSEKLRSADASLTKAETLYRGGKAKDAAASLAAAQADLVELAAMPDVSRAFEPLRRRLVNLHDLMDLDGVKVVAIDASLAAASEKPVAGKPGRPVVGKTPAAAGAAGMISFVRQVAPLLIAKCDKCHVTGNKGGFSMANYTALMRGNKAGSVISPGKGEGSRIIDVIESGDMPRGGGKVEKDDLAMLVKWIDQGAKFDGADPTAMLASLAPGAAPAKPAPEPGPMLQVASATGKESVSFARDLAPQFTAHCIGCHGAGQNAPGGMLRVTTFAGLLKGGDSGNAIQPGNGAKSLLVRKLKGTAGDRMPKGQPPLSDEMIAKFEKWINEGAHFDGHNANATMARVTAVYTANHDTHEQLSAARVESSKNIWHLGIPDDAPATKETKNFLIMGNVSDTTLDQVATAADQAAVMVAKLFKVPEDKPLVKGRMTLFLFRQRIDYVEFGKMVEERELGPAARGHLKYDVVNAYAAMVPPTAGEYSLNAMVAQAVAGLYVASLGDVPRWFYDGAGATVGLRVDKNDPRLREWEGAVSSALGVADRPTAFLNGPQSEPNDVLAMGFVKSLMTNTAKFQQVLNALKAGENFDSAFQRAYRGSPEEAAMAWARKH